MIHNNQIAYVIAHFEDGRVYTGKMHNDLPNGKGKMVYPDGATYEGEWQNGVINGVATVTDVNVNGSRYTGKMHNDLPNGKGKMVYPNGTTYEGEWQNGALNGVATVTDVYHNTLTGKFTNGTISGYACLKDQNGYSYREYDNQGRLINNNIPEETIEDLKLYHVGYDYL